MIIDDILSHEVKTDSNRLRWMLRTQSKLSQSEIQVVINRLIESKFVYVENMYDGSQSFYLKPKLQLIEFAHSHIPQSRYIK